MSRRDNYERGAQRLYELVRDWDGEPPRFAFPPKEFALIADLRQVGHQLALNDGARELVRLAITVGLAEFDSVPTTIMRVVLEMLGRPIEWRSLSELGFDMASFAPMPPRGKN
jgi:hypothetical protein